MKLQERLDAFKASFESGAPPFNVPQWVIEVMHRATEELRQSGQAEQALGGGSARAELCPAEPGRSDHQLRGASQPWPAGD